MLLAAAIIVAACGGDSESNDPSGSADPDAVTTSPVADSGVLVIEDEPYREPAGESGGGSTVDIYVGDGNEDGPAVVLLHGFGMTGPGRPLTSLDALAEEIAGFGSTVFAFGWHSGPGFSAESVADLSCVGPFVAARAAELGVDPDRVVVVGHSMGAETGSMLAFSSFDLAPSPDCAETGEVSDPVAFVGVAGAYGMVGGPLDDDHTRFRVRTYPRGTFEELDAEEEILPGLTAAQLYELDGYRAVPPVTDLDIVLVVGSEDQYAVSAPDVTAAFAAELATHDIEVETVIVDGANHDNIVFPDTDFGPQTLAVIADTLTGTG